MARQTVWVNEHLYKQKLSISALFYRPPTLSFLSNLLSTGNHFIALMKPVKKNLKYILAISEQPFLLFLPNVNWSFSLENVENVFLISFCKLTRLIMPISQRFR